MCTDIEERIMLVNNIGKPSFKGTTNCYVTADIHQEARKFAGFLKNISQQSKNTSNVLFLNSGDLFGGIYSRNLTKDLLIDFAEKNPHIAIVTTLGNNDFISEPGYDEPGVINNAETQHQFFKKAIKDFNSANIDIVCANIRTKDGKIPEGIKPYTVVYRDGDKILVTGYCIGRDAKAYKDNYYALNEEQTTDELKKAIDKEKPDAVVLLNHDFKTTCEKLNQYAEEKGFKIDFSIGGHDHDHLYNNEQQRVFHPAAYAKEMFNFKLNINAKDGIKKSYIHDLTSIKPEGTKLDEITEKKIADEENKTELAKIITPKRVYDLKKVYAHPNQTGTFVADGIKEITGTIAGFVTGSAIRSSLESNGLPIKKYDVIAVLPHCHEKVSVVELTPQELKEFLDKSVKDILTEGDKNTKFMQCSSNVKLVLDEKNEKDELKTKEIYINGKNILDKEFENKKIPFAIDGYTAKKFNERQDMPYNMYDSLVKKLTEVSENNTKTNLEYPVFEIVFADGTNFV